MLDRIRQIIIGPYRYGVTWFKRKAKNRGWIDFNKRRIWVSAGMQPGERVEIMNHEILHGIEDVAALDLPEDTIFKMAVGQVAVWRNNPEILLAMHEELTAGEAK